jgi:hypothetical protein
MAILKESKMFKASKLSQTAVIRLHGNSEQVFPLFGPVREKDWADGWDPHILHTDSENIAEHMVFQTHSHLVDEKGLYTWIVSKHAPDMGLIEYTVFTDTRLWWITILCQEKSDGKHCEATITYTFVGLNECGNERNATALATMYKHDLKDWEHAINHYLETGSILRHP